MAGVPGRTLATKLALVFRRFAEEREEYFIHGSELGSSRRMANCDIELVKIAKSRLSVSGRAAGRKLTLASGEHKANLWLREHDAEAQVLQDFQLDVPYRGSSTLYLTQTDGKLCEIRIPKPSVWKVIQKRGATITVFSWKSVLLIPSVVQWLRNGDEGSKTTIKHELGFLNVRRGGTFDEGIFSDTPINQDQLSDKITIIVPVFNAFEILQENLRRVKENTEGPWTLIIVDDASSDERVRPFLKEWTNSKHFASGTNALLLENAENLGFVGSVNRAFEIALEQNNHTVLLNSDAFVPKGWAPRLLQPILDDRQVATTTPMSNDAEIFSVPAICKSDPLLPGAVDTIDLAAQRFDTSASQAPAPTGVGFCMAINVAFLKQFPKFDEAFGRGYGEEVDWCQKVGALGGRHIGIANLFVEHAGGSSFGTATKQQLISNNGMIITARYPTYDRSVQQFISADPLASHRFALGLAWASAQTTGHLDIFIAHSLGGGAEAYLETRLDSLKGQNKAAVVIRVGGIKRLQLELHTHLGVQVMSTGSVAFCLDLFEPVPMRNVVYSCAAADPDPLGLIELMKGLSSGSGNTLEVLFHDYLPISPSYTLLDAHQQYHGVPSENEADPAHRFRGPTEIVDLKSWRKGWASLLDQAQKIIVFSDNSRSIVSEAFPSQRAKVTTVPHKVSAKVQAIPIPGQGPIPTVGVLGNIGVHKGAGVLQDLSRHLKASKQGRLVLVGNIDPDYKIYRPSLVHGSYELDELPELVKKYGIQNWLMPSIWPETFSFVTHEMINTGLPVWSFNLGAQGDLVRERSGAHPGGTLDIPNDFSGIVALAGHLFPARK